jgi:hypothetical protein
LTHAGSEKTLAWADWTARYCLPMLLEQLGEEALAETARSLRRIVDPYTSDLAFSVLRDVSDRVCDRFGAGTEQTSAMVVSTLTLAEISEVGGSDVAWLLMRARSDAIRLAEYAVRFGVTDELIATVASEGLADAPRVP